MSSKNPQISEASFSEEEYGKRIDRCFTDAVVKGSGGLLLGATLSLLLFRKRSWPIIMGTGFGIGMAFKNCEKELNSINTPPKIKKKNKDFFEEIRKFFIIQKRHFEDENNIEKLNRCITDLLIKGSGGLLIGTALSAFSYNPLPVFAAISFGVGAAYRNCVYDFKNTKTAFGESAYDENVVEGSKDNKNKNEQKKQEDKSEKDENKKDESEKNNEDEVKKNEEDKDEQSVDGQNEDKENLKENDENDDMNRNKRVCCPSPNCPPNYQPYYQQPNCPQPSYPLPHCPPSYYQPRNCVSPHHTPPNCPCQNFEDECMDSQREWRTYCPSEC